MNKSVIQLRIISFNFFVLNCISVFFLHLQVFCLIENYRFEFKNKKNQDLFDFCRIN